VEKVDELGKPTRVLLMTSLNRSDVDAVHMVHLQDITVVDPTILFDGETAGILMSPPWHRNPQHIHLFPVNVDMRGVLERKIGYGPRIQVARQSLSKLKGKSNAAGWLGNAPTTDCYYNNPERRRVSSVARRPETEVEPPP
jgi:hypothetical protein